MTAHILACFWRNKITKLIIELSDQADAMDRSESEQAAVIESRGGEMLHARAFEVRSGKIRNGIVV